MYKDYFVSMQLQPQIDNIIDNFNPRLINQLSNRYIGLNFNNSIECLNASADMLFILLLAIIFNNEGANRQLYFQDAAGINLASTATIASGTSTYWGQNLGIVFNRIRITAAGGLVANAGTTITIVSLQLIR